MIVLFTDFGRRGPYTGQVAAVLHREAPDVPVVDLFADAPSRDPQASAYLLAAYVDEFPEGSVFLCVVDPGVGSDRPACVVRADGRWFVGPGNGLTELVIRRARDPVACWRIDWSPAGLSASFHGRDLFAPVAARLAQGEAPPGPAMAIEAIRRTEWPDDFARILWIDDYGNAVTGLRAASVSPSSMLVAGDRRLGYARTFVEVPAGSAFWYANAVGLVEIAVNLGSAAAVLGLAPGAPVALEMIAECGTAPFRVYSATDKR